MTKTIRTILIDDEKLARQMVRDYLTDFPDIEIICECQDGLQAVEAIDRLHPDLVFLDVEMPECSGVEVLENLQVMPEVIFSTAYDRYAINAFEINAVDYLLKPYDRERFALAMQRALVKIKGAETSRDRLEQLLFDLRSVKPAERIWVRESGKLFPIRIESIDWIEAMDNYACLHVGICKHLIGRTMNSLQQVLDPRLFMRIHRSTIVNLDRIAEMRSSGDGSYRVVLHSGKRLTLSRSYAQELRDQVF